MSLDRRRALMGKKEIAPILPSEYQAVEYIGANGEQYIDWTPVSPPDKGSMGFSTEYYITRRDNKYGPKLFKSYSLTDYTALSFGPRTDSITSSGQVINVLLVVNGYSNFNVSSDVFSTLNKWHKCEANYKQSGIVTHDGIKTNDAGGATAETTTKKVQIFRDTTDNNVKFYGMLKSLKISRQEKDVLDFVPCYRKADSVVGLYELYTGTFLTNAGTGTFTKGADVN